jgi:uncharacterized SAM-binding protein YcdF (DUF218 family)
MDTHQGACGEKCRNRQAGQISHWLDSDISEAESMQTLLEEWSVPDASILAESASRNTHENAVFTREVLEEHGLHRVLLVTSAMHILQGVVD